ncbi:hypothetical protein BGZ63DRAFT_70523 [Mariannaea sp. PMI_226]|nr:hypothetical protein BGZ63DRAFT_70523 [Mariannaea sp. PMI_226]
MDPFGLIGLIGLAGQVLNSMIQLGLDMKDAPSEARDFVRQLQVLKTAISETNTNLVLNSDFREAFQGRHSTILSELDSTTELTDTQSMVSACVDELKAMIETLKKRSQNKINWTRIKSGFVAQKTKDAVDNLERQCRILNSLVAIDAVVLNARTFNTVQLIRKEQQKTLESVEKIHDRLDAQRNAEEQKAIFDWLSSADYVTQHHDQISKRQPGTGTWFLESHEYNVWLTQNQGTLFCPGIPGAGKTILSATLIDHLLESYKGDLDIGVGYLYCNYQRQETQKADDLLAALLKQLCQRVDLIPHSLAALYDDFKDKSRPPFVGVSKCLQSAISAYSQVFVVIDALDECNEFEREKFLTELRNIQESSHLNLFATSRFTGDIISHFEGCSTLEVRARRGDIEMYLDQNMKKLKSFVQRNPKLQEDIKESISTAADGMYVLDSIFLPRKTRRQTGSLSTGFYWHHYTSIL